MLIEELAKYYLIMSQKNRNINEIYFDYNHEKLYEKLHVSYLSNIFKKKGQPKGFNIDRIRYRRNEILLKKTLYFFYWVITFL